MVRLLPWVLFWLVFFFGTWPCSILLFLLVMYFLFLILVLAFVLMWAFLFFGTGFIFLWLFAVSFGRWLGHNLLLVTNYFTFFYPWKKAVLLYTLLLRKITSKSLYLLLSTCGLNLSSLSANFCSLHLQYIRRNKSWKFLIFSLYLQYIRRNKNWEFLIFLPCKIRSLKMEICRCPQQSVTKIC